MESYRGRQGETELRVQKRERRMVVGGWVGGDQESLRWEKTEMVRGRESRNGSAGLNIQQLCPDLLTLGVHALNVA